LLIRLSQEFINTKNPVPKGIGTGLHIFVRKLFLSCSETVVKFINTTCSIDELNDSCKERV